MKRACWSLARISLRFLVVSLGGCMIIQVEMPCYEHDVRFTWGIFTISSCVSKRERPAMNPQKEPPPPNANAGLGG